MHKYIYESANWPHFIWGKEAISSKLAEVNKKAGYLFGRLHDLGLDTQLRAMTQMVTDSVVDSYGIEGILIDPAQVRSSVARRLGVDIQSQTEPSHYIDGIVEMMLDATTNYRTPLTEDRLLSWHHALFPAGRSGMQGLNVGCYRTSGMDVVSGMLGREKIHYHAPEASAIPSMMSEYLDWLNNNTPKDYVHSAIAHLYFISIHPFDDGNGRIARAISDMTLSQADDSPMRYFSMSSQVNREKKRYYDILERTQRGDGDLTEWIAWYLECLGRAIDNSDNTISMVIRKAIFWQHHAGEILSERQRDVLNFYLDGYEGKFTVKNYAKQAEVSDDTAARDIKDLIAKGILSAKDETKRNVEYEISI